MYNYSQIHQTDFKENVTREHYEGVVWCPHLPNTNFVARRNNRIFITGNTFPEELILNPIKSSTSEKGCCPACNAPYKRILLKKPMVIRKTDRMAQMGEFGRTQASGTMLSPAESKTVGWQQTCSCILDCAWGDPEHCLVLDPFMGSGTVGVVSKKLGRDFVGIDLNADYCKMAEERIAKVK
jgi:hypothetical protein